MAISESRTSVTDANHHLKLNVWSIISSEIDYKLFRDSVKRQLLYSQFYNMLYTLNLKPLKTFYHFLIHLNI